MRNILLFVLTLLSFMWFVACASSNAASDDQGESYGSTVSTGSGHDTSTGTNGGPGAPGEGGEEPQAGTLTAGAWDDNLNWDFFDGYRSEFLSAFPEVAQLEVDDRVMIEIVTESGEPLSGAEVLVEGQGGALLAATAGSDGRLLFFPGHDGASAGEALSITITPPGASPLTMPAPQGNQWNIVVPGVAAALPAALDLAFVVDATGSMGDEISYLQAEIKGIVDSIQENFGPLDLRYALIVYRDENDDYLTHTFDFTDSLGEFSSNLDEQAAGGGGDHPEAMHAALAEMNALSWRGGHVARLAFVVADAPPHDAHGAATLAEADEARRAGIRLYPIAASGTEATAEYFMRQMAQLTLARYLFLTDDSGVGDSHAEPTIPCYQVQYLNDLMNRMIASELTGTRVPADPEDVLRKVGNPDEHGVCLLEGGEEVQF